MLFSQSIGKKQWNKLKNLFKITKLTLFLALRLTNIKVKLEYDAPSFFITTSFLIALWDFNWNKCTFNVYVTTTSVLAVLVHLQLENFGSNTSSLLYICMQICADISKPLYIQSDVTPVIELHVPLSLIIPKFYINPVEFKALFPLQSLDIVKRSK